MSAVRKLAGALAIAALAPVGAPPASAAPPPPAELEVQGGEETWRPDRSFHLRWRNPTAGSPVAAVHYQLRDPLGIVVIGERKLEWAATELDPLRVPDLPGAYTAQVWLEDATGAQGPAAAAKLRFDDTRPGAVAPVPPATWVGRSSFPFAVRVQPAEGEPPPSGIRGYAVSVDATPGAAPCAQQDVCSEAETDLQAGDDTLAIPQLPEGVSFVHAVAVSGAGLRSAAVGRAVVRVDETDPVTELNGLPRGWVDHAVTLSATATDSGSGMEPAGSMPEPFTAIRIDGRRPTVTPGRTATLSVVEDGSHEVAYYARDLAGNVDDGGEVNGVPNRPPSTARVRIDREPPRVAFRNGQEPGDPELIRAAVADPLSGAETSRGWIGLRRAGSGDAFVPLPAAPAGAAELRARWDSDAYPPGRYELRATAYDAAGNVAVTGRRADGSEMTLSNPLKAATSVGIGFGGATLSAWRCRVRQGRRRCRRATYEDLERRPAARNAPFGREVLVSGRLTGSGGSPLTGRPVRVVERGVDGGDRASIAWSDGDGRFSLRLPPGSSREIVAVFEGSRTLARSTSRTLSLGVRSGVRLSASAALARIGGPPLIFRGRLAAAPGTAAAGRSVQLQFRLPGLPWSEFRTVRTDGRGRFRYAYRFSDDDSRGARFQFRAYAPAQDDWPYEPGGSRPVAVRGR